MDLVTIAVVALVLSAPVVIWDLATGSGSAALKERFQPLIQFAYLAVFVAGFGLLLKFISFAAVMLLAVIVTGVIGLWDRMRASTVVASTPSGETAAGAPPRESPGVELAKSFFPVILIVFAVRSFLVEPFKIPSGSMIPTLLVGDFILVNKFTYGIRLPVANVKLVNVNEPKRGDVMVFRYPENPGLDYIKRIVGVPGDKVSYIHKKLTINGQPVSQTPNGTYNYVESGLRIYSRSQFAEKVDGTEHTIIVEDSAPTLQRLQVHDFPFRDKCEYSDEGFTCTVPAGHYFMMGDNRDSSSDSRYWGFVPEENIVGKAFVIWLNLGDFSRIGRVIH